MTISKYLQIGFETRIVDNRYNELLIVSHRITGAIVTYSLDHFLMTDRKLVIIAE